MRVSLVFNEKAGTAASHDAVMAGLAEIGWHVGEVISPKEIDTIPRKGANAVVAAGGDGTIAKVAKHLAGTERPIAIIPMGTANNVARSLGLGVDPIAAVRGLANPVERWIDLGIAHAGSEEELFIEGFGIGVFADIMAERASRKDKKLRKALRMIADELEAYEPQRFEVIVGGRDVSGPYVLAAVMNGRSLGPALMLAPEAMPDDGELDVVLVGPRAKDGLVAHLRRALEDGDIVLPAFETMRATEVRIRADGQWAHVDDASKTLDGHVALKVLAGAVRLLAPSPAPVER
jgi:diacylglycerol kinase family enzyme